MTIERHSPTWLAIETFVGERIAQLQADNESPMLGPTETAYLRGQIAAFRAVMNHPKDVMKPTVAPDPYESALL